MNANHLVHGYGEEAVGRVVPHLLLRKERDPAEVIEALQLIRMKSSHFEFLAVVGVVLISMAHGPAEPLQLQRLQCAKVHGFEFGTEHVGPCMYDSILFKAKPRT